MAEPSEDFKAECMRTYGRVLTGQHAHWCPEWDFMPIDETCAEWQSCTCNFKEKER